MKKSCSFSLQDNFMPACKHQPRGTCRLWINIDSHSDCKSDLITTTVDNCSAHVRPSVNAKHNTLISNKRNAVNKLILHTYEQIAIKH